MGLSRFSDTIPSLSSYNYLTMFSNRVMPKYSDRAHLSSDTERDLTRAYSLATIYIVETGTDPASKTEAIEPEEDSKRMADLNNPFVQVRRKLQWSQEELAEALGVHRTTVAKKEIGSLPISKVDLLALESLLAKHENE